VQIESEEWKIKKTGTLTTANAKIKMAAFLKDALAKEPGLVVSFAIGALL
jgi:hypothetical protein